GLGATGDDITRNVISRVLERELRVDRNKEKLLRDWYLKKGRDFRDIDRMQASCPEGGILLDNRVGLAYGFYLRTDHRHIFSLPGVPGEMKNMFLDHIIPILEKKALFSSSYRFEILNFSDIAEYTLDRILQQIVSRYPGIEYGTRASSGIIRVRFESTSTDLSPCLEQTEERLKDNFIARGDRALEEIAAELLVKNSLSLGVAESCTGGLLSKTVTDIPGSSRYFYGGIVSYSNQAKVSVLGVSPKTLEKHGAVSDCAAREMARGVLERLGCDISISITGIAGPSGGSTQKPVGTVFVCMCREGSLPEVEKGVFPGDREGIRQRAVNKALFMLVNLLKGEKVENISGCRH
ncbi:MAG: nicotinamide-nucleotide amidohydrolase family protein, partial [Spirochaetota bacterium]